MNLHPQVIEKDGKKEFVILPYDEFVGLQASLENYEDLTGCWKSLEQRACGAKLESMRGRSPAQLDVLTMINLEDRIPARHPIRRIKRMVEEVLRSLESMFEEMYASAGRPSIPPERLLKAKILEALYSVRSDRQFCERLRYDLLFQWFLDMNPNEPAFNASTFSKNMERLLEHHAAECFFHEVVELARRHDWVSDQHFSVDGTLIEAWASMKSFRPKDEPPSDDDSNSWSSFQGEKRSNQTHESKTDPEAKLLKKGKGKEAKLCFSAHAAMENRNGLCVLLEVTPAVGEGCTEAEVASRQLDELIMQGYEVESVGADKGYHNARFVSECRERDIAPHVARMDGRKTPGLDGRHARSKAYKASQKVRKRAEEIFGWMKTTGNFRKSRYRGVARSGLAGHFTAAACNLVRMAKLIEYSPPSEKAAVA
jgi:transposase